MVTTSVERHTKSSAADTLRCGKLPTPKVAPGRGERPLSEFTCPPVTYEQKSFYLLVSVMPTGERIGKFCIKDVGR
jgi:hypothetical protein